MQQTPLLRMLADAGIAGEDAVTALRAWANRSTTKLDEVTAAVGLDALRVQSVLAHAAARELKGRVA